MTNRNRYFYKNKFNNPGLRKKWHVMGIKYNPVVPSFICRITQIISELFQLVNVSGLELQT